MTANEFLQLLSEENIDMDTLQETLVKLLCEKGLKIATAESCTGGLLSKRITDVSGASAVFDCGVCSYANRIKTKLLSVREETLTKYSAVSEKTAIEMASGICMLSGADIGVSTTGIAGPLGGNQYKPVGTVFIGLFIKGRELVYKLSLGDNGQNDRQTIRGLAASAALYLTIRAINDIM